MKFILVWLSLIYSCSFLLRAMESNLLADVEEKIGIYSLETLANNIRICSCNKMFNTSISLKEHVRNKHVCSFSIEGEQQSFFRCCKCPQLYTDINELLTHCPEHTYEVLYTCLECEKDFFVLAKVKDHIFEHTNALFISNSPALGSNARHDVSLIVNNNNDLNIEQEEQELETELYNRQNKEDNSMEMFAYFKEMELLYEPKSFDFSSLIQKAEERKNRTQQGESNNLLRELPCFGLLLMPRYKMIPRLIPSNTGRSKLNERTKKDDMSSFLMAKQPWAQFLYNIGKCSCGEPINNYEKIVAHIQSEHYDEGLKFPYHCIDNCRFSTRRFAKLNDFFVHLNDHKDGVIYNCNACGMPNIHPKQFKTHLRAHGLLE